MKSKKALTTQYFLEVLKKGLVFQPMENNQRGLANSIAGI